MHADALDRWAKPFGGLPDQRAVEGAGDTEPDGAASSRPLGLRARLGDGVVLSRDDHLARAVVVRGPHAFDAAADLFDDRVVEPENRGHRARALARGLRGREPSLADERDGIADAQRPSSRQR